MSTRDELAREELVAELRNANLTTHLFITPDGAADARRATDVEAAELAADWVMGMFDHLAGVLGYSRPHVVETVEELDALPKGSVVLTEQGGVYQAGDPGFDRDWWETGQEWTQASMDLALPATVIHLPEEKP